MKGLWTTDRVISSSLFLDEAACGDPARAALFDSTCFGFAPPQGGDDQRRWIQRRSQVGDSCAPVRDGIGAAFYGSCDPHAQFCCYDDPSAPGACALPFDGDGKPRTGACAEAPDTGEACAATPPIAVCRTGSSCDADTQTCVAPSVNPLQVGDPCIDASYNLLGDCVDSFCDLFGSGGANEAASRVGSPATLPACAWSGSS